MVRAEEPHRVVIEPSIRDALVATIRHHLPDIVAVYVFGSRARGRGRRDSDLDIALLLPPGADVDVSRRIALAGDLRDIADCVVDLSALDAVDATVLTKEVVTTGSLLYTNDEAAVALFEMRALREYARLCEDRQPVLAAYAAETIRG